jgi:hypothetical protein
MLGDPMPWSVTHYYLPLVTAAVFALIGVHLLVRVFRAPRDPSERHTLGVVISRTYVALFGLVFLGVGILVTVLLMQVSPRERESYVAAVLGVKSSDIDAIEIRPAEARGQSQCPSLVSQPYRVTDENAVQAICEALNAARPSSEKYSREIWECNVVLRLESGIHQAAVRSTTNNGCLVDLWCSDAFYGQFRSDALSTAIEEALRARGEDAQH